MMTIQMNIPDKDTFLKHMDEVMGKHILEEDKHILEDFHVYPSFLRFFQTRTKITRDDFVIAAHFAYGWMPRMLNLNGTDEDWDQAASLVTEAKNHRLEKDNLNFLQKLVNNSIVGVSKILHFANPQQYAIWDSHVCHYLTKHVNVGEADDFLQYLSICDTIAAWPEVENRRKAMRDKIHQDLTSFRAIELTMYIHEVQ
jgi:hypothetical protein